MDKEKILGIIGGVCYILLIIELLILFARFPGVATIVIPIVLTIKYNT